MLRENDIKVTINNIEYTYGDGENGIISIISQMIENLINLQGEVGQHGTVCVGDTPPIFNQCQLWINTNKEFGNGAAFYKIPNTTGEDLSHWVPISALWTNHNGLVDFGNTNEEREDN